MSTSTFSIDGILSTQYKNLIFKNKTDIKNCCARLLKNIQIAWQQFRLAITRWKIVTPKSLAQLAIKHTHNHLQPYQLDVVKKLIAYAIAHMKAGIDRDLLTVKLAELKQATTLSKTKGTPTPVTSKPTPPDPTENPKNLNSTPASLLFKIIEFIKAPSATTALEPDDQGLVFAEAARLDINLNDEHMKYLRKADTFYFANNEMQDEAFIQKVFDSCERIKYVVMASPPQIISYADLLRWRKNVSFLTTLKPKQSFLFAFADANFAQIFSYINKDDTEKILAKLNDTSKDAFITDMVCYNDFNDAAIKQFIKAQPLHHILSLVNNAASHPLIDKLRNVIEIRESSLVELQEILDQQPIEIVDEVTKKAIEFTNDIDAEKAMACIAYQAYRDIKERGSYNLEALLDRFESTITRWHFLEMLLRMPQNSKSIKILLKVLSDAQFPSGNLVLTILKQALELPEATPKAFDLFFRNFSKFPGINFSLTTFEIVLNAITTQDKLVTVLRAANANLSAEEEKVVLQWLIEGCSQSKIPLSANEIRSAIVYVGGRLSEHFFYLNDEKFRKNFILKKASELRSHLKYCTSKADLKKLLKDHLPGFVECSDHELFLDKMIKKCPSSECEIVFHFLTKAHYEKTHAAKLVKHISKSEKNPSSLFTILNKYLNFYSFNSEDTDYIFQKIIPACSNNVLENLSNAIPTVTSDTIIDQINKAIEDEKEFRKL